MGIAHELYVYPNSENLLFGYFGHYAFGTRVIHPATVILLLLKLIIHKNLLHKNPTFHL